MRRGVAWFTTVVGMLVALVGLVVAVVVGPDDTVSRSPHGLPAAGSKATMAYSSWPDLFPYRDLTLVVTARGGGSVFVGTANPLDAASYADGVRAYRFSEVSASGRITGGQASDDTRTQPAVAPTKASFWVDKTSATRQAQLRVPLDGSPLSVVAVAERGPLSLGFGVRLAGLFWTTVAVLLLGLALLTYGVWRLRRRPAADATGVRVGGVTAGGVALLLLASGCGWVPQAVEPEPATKVPMTKGELQSVLDDYDRRNNAAIKAAETKFDGSLWARADAGAVLAADQFGTRYQRATGKKGQGKPFRHKALGLYASADVSYPLSFMASSDIYFDERPTKSDLAETYVSLDLWTRACVTCSWRMSVSTAVLRSRQPVPRPVGQASVASASRRDLARSVFSDLTRYVNTGRSKVVSPTTDMRQLRADLVKAQSFETVRTEAEPNDEDPMILVRVEGGVLALLQNSFSRTYTPKYGVYSWGDDAMAKAVGQTGDRYALTQSGVLTWAVSLPDGSRPVVLGVSGNITGP